MLESASGHIAQVCLGGWTECGSLNRRYEVPYEGSAHEDLKRQTEREGWKLVRVKQLSDGFHLRAEDNPQSATKYAEFNVGGGKATVTYVER